MKNRILPGGSLLVVKDLKAAFPGDPDMSRVLRGISLSLNPGEILGIVGESGSGKTIFSKCLIRLESPAKIISGSIFFDDQELTAKTEKELRLIRGKRIALVMQNPKAAMDPVFTMGSQFDEVISLNKFSKKKKKEIIYNLLKNVGIASPKERCRQYPHEWSRGMLQRAQLVMAFSASPELLILDEVTSALDPTICLQILDLIVRFKHEHHAGIILITHDLSIASKICDRLAVMHQGLIIEFGTVSEIFDNPVHPYTKLLVSSI